MATLRNRILRLIRQADHTCITATIRTHNCGTNLLLVILGLPGTP